MCSPLNTDIRIVRSDQIQPIKSRCKISHYRTLIRDTYGTGPVPFGYFYPITKKHTVTNSVVPYSNTTTTTTTGFTFPCKEFPCNVYYNLQILSSSVADPKRSSSTLTDQRCFFSSGFECKKRYRAQHILVSHKRFSVLAINIQH